jgi:hypothetical protein
MKTKLNGILSLLQALVVHTTFAQEKTVSVTVSDSSGALLGVRVLVKGTKKGSESNFNVKYTIEANTGDAIIFRYLGHKIVKK